MNGIALFNALTKIDDRFIDRAAASPAPVPAVQTKPRRSVRRWVEIAACACLLLTVAVVCFSRVGLFAPKGAKMKGGGDYYSDQTGARPSAQADTQAIGHEGTWDAIGEGTRAVVDENTGYSLSVVDGRNYLNFDGGNASYSSIKGTVYFDTVDEMVTAIRTNSLSPDQCETIRNSFPQDENGIRIVDLDHVFDAALPDELISRGVVWEGPSYAFEFDDENGVLGNLRVLTKEDYAEVYAYEYETFFDRANLTVISREHDAERDAEVVLYETPSGTTYQTLRYTLPNGVTVVEAYFAPGGTSSAIPVTVELYGETDDAAFYAELYELTERPTVEWLSRFGLTER